MRIIKHEVTLNEGEIYAGIVVGGNEQVDGDLLPGESKHADYHLIILPQEVEKINWQDARDWAKSIGGDLPTLLEFKFLYLNTGNQFMKEYNFYWSREPNPNAISEAMMQNFREGHQITNYKDSINGCRARAIRRELA
jgi:hypothetical protein